MTTNVIQDAIEKNDVIFSEKWEATHDRIDRCSEETRLLKNQVVDLEALSGLQQTALQSCQNTIARLEETVAKLTVLVTKLEKSVCRCQDHLLSLALHYTPGEEEEMVKETEEEEGGEEEEGLEYATNTPLGGSYTTPPSTGGRSSPSLAISYSPTLVDSNPENNMALCTKELEACICHRTLFLLVFFIHFQPNFTFLTLPFSLMLIFVMLIPLCLSRSRTNDKEHNLTGIIGHRTTCLLGY